MITEEQFVNRVFDNFRDLNRKIDENYEKLDKKVDDLCTRTSNLESKFRSHVDVGAVIKNLKKEQNERNNRRSYIAMGIMGLVFTIYEIIVNIN